MSADAKRWELERELIEYAHKRGRAEGEHEGFRRGIGHRDVVEEAAYLRGFSVGERTAQGCHFVAGVIVTLLVTFGLMAYFL